MIKSTICYLILIITAAIFLGISCASDREDHEPRPNNHALDGEEIPLIYHMSFMSRYAKKLYFSGIAENWELADIYSHEIEEIAEVIAEGNHIDDEVNISELMASMLMPQIKRIEEAIDKRDHDLFEERYRTLIQTCNQCHTAANYGAVRVVIPEINPFNQDFSMKK